jgi:hypothetical protein
MKTGKLLALLLVAGSSACAAPRAGANLSQTRTGLGDWLPGLDEQVQFDHGCAPKRVQVIRFSAITVDLDVCGAVRRYKRFGSQDSMTPFTWLDVTSLYPASALSAPLAPP